METMAIVRVGVGTAYIREKRAKSEFVPATT